MRIWARYSESGRIQTTRLGIWMSGAGPVTPAADVALQLRLEAAALDRKLVALRAHASQVTGLIAELSEDTFRRWWCTESFVAAEPTAPRPTAPRERDRASSAAAGRSA